MLPPLFLTDHRHPLTNPFAMTLYIFNPEHDLCMANGGIHYMAPESALRMAQAHCDVMRYLYGDAIRVVTAAETVKLLSHPEQVSKVSAVVPWGWNATLRQQLVSAGCSETLLPSLRFLECQRRLQHRATLLPLQPETQWMHRADEVEEMLRTSPRLVLKAPWSGSGRGIRWVDGRLSEQDRLWMARVSLQQDGFIAEPRREVTMELALEYEVRRRDAGAALYFRGLSLFESRHGVYDGNWLLDDDAISRRVSERTDALAATRRRVERWLRQVVVPHYLGPIGVDLYVDSQGSLYVGEMNLRHTMGMVSHALVQRYPEWAGHQVSPLSLHQVVFSLGSNMGNRAALLRRAVRELSEQVGVVTAQSSIVETEPWGFHAQRKFMNQVLVVDTLLTPDEVLERMLGIEKRLGRRRDYDPLHPPAEHEYQSRPIDIDIILYDDAVIESPLLQVPHPRMHLRRFVLEPLCELMPQKEHPVFHRTMRELLETCE